LAIVEPQTYVELIASLCVVFQQQDILAGSKMLMFLPGFGGENRSLAQKSDTQTV
jgi:hypothetical protein